MKRSAIKRKPTTKTVRKKPKKTPKQRLDREMDGLMGRFVRGRGLCFFTGKFPFTPRGVVQNCHCERRSRSAAIKFCPLNGMPGDMTAHVILDNSQLDWGAFLNEHAPGLLERLVGMKRWALANRGQFRIEDVWAEQKAWYMEMHESGTDWWEWFHSGAWKSYVDPIERMMGVE